jgi:hypothetical protein
VGQDEHIGKLTRLECKMTVVSSWSLLSLSMSILNSLHSVASKHALVLQTSALCSGMNFLKTNCDGTKLQAHST